MHIDDYSRLNINEDNTNRNSRKYSDDNKINTIASENPISTQNYHYSSSSSYETKHRSTGPNDREQYHSRESSPSAPVQRNQSPLPTSGYIASSTRHTSSNTYRTETSHDSTSPTSTYIPQHDYYNVIFLFFVFVYKIVFLSSFRLNSIQMIDIHQHHKIMIEHPPA